ncbi:MAG: TIGR02444 family protein [Rhodospirillaceae bacterium]
MTPVVDEAVKANPLWDFVTWAYKRDGVEKACLALQNRLNADVNIVLFCIWLSFRGAGTTNLATYLGTALKISRDWQRNLIEPMRTTRQNLKHVLETGSFAGVELQAAEALRNRIKQCELDLEHLQTLALYALVTTGDDQGVTRSPAEQKDDAHNNLTVYFAASGIKLDPLAQTHVMRILTAIFGA